MSQSSSRAPALVVLLFVLSIVILLPGSGEITSVTGKDEYLLSLRTPMHMLEGDHGWLPWLDGAPRLKKPPLVYWLTSLSYQAFGVSLLSARLVAILFAGLLVAVTGLLAWRLLPDPRYLLASGLVVLSSAGVMIDGRRLMLDIPVAALALLAFLLLLIWLQRDKWPYAIGSGVVLGLGMLVKGPVALIFFTAALLALMLSSSLYRRKLVDRWKVGLLLLASSALVALPWFGYVWLQYPELASQTLAGEVAERQLLNPSLAPLSGMLAMGLPWSLAVFYLLWQRPQPDQTDADAIDRVRFLIWWLLLSLLPFFLFKTFGRYLYGGLVPLSLLVALLVLLPDHLQRARWWLRCGAILSLLFTIALLGMVTWFRGFDALFIAPVLFLLAFAWCWWRAQHLFYMAFTAVLLWVGLLNIVYPRLGINAIPAGLVEQVRGEYVVLFAGPQPAMLPIASGQGMRDTSQLISLPARERDSCRGILIFSPVKHFVTARRQLRLLDHQWQELGRYRLLSSRGSWIRFAHEDATFSDWQQAFMHRDLDSLGTEVILVRSTARQCHEN